MGILKSILSLFKKSDKAVDVGLDLITRGAKGIDSLIYTEQEKAGDMASLAKLQLEFIKTTLNESAVRTFTRRVMAWGLLGFGIFLTVWALVMDLLGTIYNPLLKVHAKTAWDMFQAWSPWVGMAVGFYLGVHILRSVGKKE
jgi:hypothetical protein